jgi:hypothetical protein
MLPGWLATDSSQGDVMMNNNLLLGLFRCVLPVPRVLWQMQVSRNARHLDAGLGFMSAEHHLIRNFVVTELPRVGKPLPPDSIAQSLNLPITQVGTILDDLEKHMTFLFRNEQGAVTWAYPVTVERTPHHLALSTGDQVYAA